MNDIFYFTVSAIFTCWFIFLILSISLFFILYSNQHFRECRRIFRKNATCLLVIAHPDDETMFFAPTIMRLVENGTRIFVLCVTTGNAQGYGHIRKNELIQAVQLLGIKSSDVTILDIDEFPDEQAEWPETERLSRLIFKTATSINTDIVLTFDDYGITGHPNHIGCWKAVRFLVINGYLPLHIKVLLLESVNVVRKFSSIYDIVLSWLNSPIFIIVNPCPVFRAMFQHKSQLVWFRYLYLAFSRYVIFNTLRVMERK